MSSQPSLPQLDAILDLLLGLGTMLMAIDHKLEQVVYLLGGGEDEEADS
ncbi:MAG TPA: hypothetical protein VIL56_00920 [Gaiellaceae bacterium]